MREEFECEEFVIRLVRRIHGEKDTCDNSRAGSCDLYSARIL